ncbi:MAG: FAD-dependent oxidoreductase [Acidimicrobiia bacterium]|nr:FAD-dependent oxidoreductase [Acidimicrobiia bacterium]
MNKRETAIERISGADLDVLVIGGGFNGAVSAMGLAAHGASVAMVDRADFGSGTSQESSNMVWGGFKYLEGYEVPLVVGLCRSRNRLAAAYPSRISEVRFLAALDASSPHPPWFAMLGATAYWGMGAFRTRPPSHRRRSKIAALEPAIDTAGVRGGIEYSDFLLLDNDARFVSEMALDAAGHGAAIANYVEVTAAERTAGHWAVQLRDTTTGACIETSARVLVNAAGPRVGEVSDMTDAPTERRLVLSKGIHLVVPQITDSGRVLAFYDDERRLFYVLPMGHRSVIGTTDTRVDDPDVAVTAEERAFVLDQINKRLALDTPLTVRDIIAERCGVRSLVLAGDEQAGDRDWTELSRRHAVEVDRSAAVVSVLGGKLSDCLNVGSEVIDAVRSCGVDVPSRRTRWFGEPDAAERDRFLLRSGHLDLPAPRFDAVGTAGELLWRRYGRRAHEVVALVEGEREMGRPMIELGDLCRAEVEVAAAEEWIVMMEDFLRRRTQLAQLNRTSELRADPGVVDAARILLGPTAAEAWAAGSDGVRRDRRP